MADVAVGTVRGVEVVAALDELCQFRLEGGELGPSRTNGVELGVQHAGHVGTRAVAVVAKVDDAADLDQRQAGRLGVADEPDTGDGRVVVAAVAGPGVRRT